MADRKDWFFRQIVAEDELDEAFDGLENADRNIAADSELGQNASNQAEFGGILDGLTVSILGSLDLQITAGTSYDSQGRNVRLDSVQTVTLTNEGSTSAGAGGVPTGTTIAPVVGDEVWAAVYLVYDRLLTDPRVDGNNQSVYFDRVESFHIEIAAGPTKTTVSTPDVDGAPRQSDKILLCDAKVEGSVSGAVITAVDTSRRETWFNVTGSPQSIERGSLRDVLKDILTLYNNHVSDLTDLHTLGALGYSGGDPWADGTLNPAADVESHLDKIITDLNSTVDSAGAKKIGARAQSGVLQTPNQTQLTSLTAGTLEAQLTELMNAVNGRVFRGGDAGIDGDLLPSATGKKLGASGKLWDINIRTMDITSTVTGDLIPSGATQDLGAGANRWNFAYVDNGLITTVISDFVFAQTIRPAGGSETFGTSGDSWPTGWIDEINTHNVQETSVITKDILVPYTFNAFAPAASNGWRWSGAGSSGFGGHQGDATTTGMFGSLTLLPHDCTITQIRFSVYLLTSASTIDIDVRRRVFGANWGNTGLTDLVMANFTSTSLSTGTPGHVITVPMTGNNTNILRDADTITFELHRNTSGSIIIDPAVLVTVQYRKLLPWPAP